MKAAKHLARACATSRTLKIAFHNGSYARGRATLPGFTRV